MVDELVDLARRGPTAGNAQGVEFLVLDDRASVDRYWDATLDQERRAAFPWPGLLDAPALVVPFGCPSRYVARYREPDKQRTGLGEGVDRWPVPYWLVDAAFAAMNLQLLALERQLGTLFFGLFDHEDEVKATFGVPTSLRAVGTVALGRPSPGQRPSRSTRRGRRPLDEVVHRGRW